MKTLRPLAALLAALAVAAAAAAREPLFVLNDPYGDDRGNGRLIYPTARSDLEPGDLDLVRLEAFREGADTLFRVTFARPVRPPGREAIDGLGTSRERDMRLGFYTFNLDIYIDIDREPGSGQVAMLPGRMAEVAVEDAWEKLVALTPRPHVLRTSIERRNLREWKREQSARRSLAAEEIRQRRRQIREELIPLVFFPNQVRVRGRSLEVLVPGDFLGSVARPGWSYAVAVTGAISGQRLGVPFFGRFPREFYDGMVLPVVPGGDREAFGGGYEDDPLQPALVDILVPEGAPREQREILDDYDSARGRRARVPGVSPVELAAGTEGRGSGSPEPRR